MSTLKKILALTLALAMVMSLGVFAAFKDQATIDEDCTSAMELMNALGVILGDNNGNANPTKTITRAEAATMIFRLMNKGKDDASIYNGMKIFTDVPSGSWFEGYVNYAYTMGIVQGRTATTFDPYAPVTGMEIAKMLLTCCGYSADKQGYTGANWAKNVQNDAFSAGMMENFGMALTVPAQRQWVAVMFSDALNCNMVRYLLGELTDVFDGTTTLGEKKFDYKVKTGTLTAIGTASLEGTGTAKYSKLDNTVSFKKLANNDLLGQQVRVYYKDSASESNVYDTVYGIFATGKSKLGTAALDEVKNPTGDKYTVGTLTAYTNGSTKVFYPNTDCKYAPAAAFSNYYGQNSNAPVRAVDTNADGYFDYIMIDFSQYGTIDISSKGVVTFTNSDDHGYAPIAKDDVADKINYVNTVVDDDVVKVTANVFTGKYDIKALSTVSGTVTRVYSEAKYALDSSIYFISSDATVNNTALALAKDVTVYVDGSYIVKAGAYDSSIAALPTNLGLILYRGTTTELGSVGGYKVVMLSQDGKINTYTVASDDNSQDVAGKLSARDDANTIYAGGALKVDMVKYTVNSDGTLKIEWPPKTNEIKNTTLQNYADATFKYKTDTMIVGGNTYRVADDAKIFVAYKKSGASTFTFAVMKASDFTGDQVAMAGFYYTSANGFNTIIGGAMLVLNPTTEGGTDYTFALKAGSTTIKGAYVYTLSASYDLYDKTASKTYRYVDVVDMNGKTATLKLDLSANKTATVDTVYTYTTTDGISTLVPYTADNSGFAVATGKLTGLSGNVMMVKSGETSTIKTLADDMKVLVMNSDDELVVGEISSLYTSVAEDQNTIMYVVDNNTSSSTYEQVIFVIEQ